MRLPLAELASFAGFRSDARFTAAAPARAEPEPKATTQPPEEDPAARAFDEGFAAGIAEAQALAAEQARIEAEARAALELSFAQLDAELAEELALRLRETVAALCEAAIAPLALDEQALVRRVERAVAMFQRAEDERTIRLHPDDIALVSDRFAADWNVIPDPSLDRGALRVETATGGVEDGPEQWRRAIAEALHQC